MITVDKAQGEIDRKIGLILTEAVPFPQAHGRVLREAVATDDDMPAFDRSAMDGYAIRLDDPADDFAVVAEIRAGDSVDLNLQPGEAVRIFTGARSPSTGLRVVPQENVTALAQSMRLTRRDPATYIRHRGEEARRGDTLLEPGIVLDATALALMAAVGKTSVLVSRRPRVLHLTTGDEIVPAEVRPGPGQIRNSNASLILGLCGEQGIEEVHHFHVGDDREAMTDALRGVEAGAFDLILISGGSGQGAYDFSAELFRLLGATLHFRQVDVRPGKPLLFGTAGSQALFGLPGNALSHFVCFHLFVRRALDRLLGRSSREPVQGCLVETMSGIANARETWWPARLTLKEGRLECRALPWKSSGDITRLPSAQALIRVPASTPELMAGTMVTLLPTRPFS